MCPSYQASRHDQHTTRSRANKLRLAMSGQRGDGSLTKDAVKDDVDLCRRCKACKSEYPTNVDMAQLKAEFLDQYYRKHGVPIRNRIFGNVGRLSSWASAIAPAVANFSTRNWLTRWLGDRLLGIDRR